MQNDMYAVCCCLGVSIGRMIKVCLEGTSLVLETKREPTQQINIIIFGSRAHSLLPREECDKIVMDTTEIQKDMGDKRVMDLKNIQKVIKEAELNGGRIKKQKPKQRKYSTLKICTYEMETCDTTMERKKKEDTTICNWSSTTERPIQRDIQEGL